MCIKSIIAYAFLDCFALSIPHLKAWAFRAFIVNEYNAVANEEDE